MIDRGDRISRLLIRACLLSAAALWIIDRLLPVDRHDGPGKQPPEPA